MTPRVISLPSALIDKSLRTDRQALQNSLDACIRSAENLIAIAGDQGKAVAKLQGFQEAFEALEKAMSAISDRIDAQVAQRKQADGTIFGAGMTTMLRRNLGREICITF